MERISSELLVVGNLAKDIVFGKEKYGGSAALVAITAKRLGLNVGIMSVLGNDDFSREYILYLKSIGIDTAHIHQTIDNIPTCEVVSAENKISSSVWTDNGCHNAMNSLPINSDIDQYKLIHLVSCSPGLSVSLAKLYNNLSYEPGPILPFDQSYFNVETVKSSRLLFLNEEEHKALVDYDKGVTENGYVYENLTAMIVTHGKDGSTIFNNGQNISIPATELKHSAVDSVGAGDNYKAGFLAGYIHNLPLKACAEIGSELGALCVQQEGGILPEKDITSVKNKYFNLNA